MRLTAIQFAKRLGQLYKGNMFRGKYRFVNKVTAKSMIELREEYEREERVMKLLLNPYLTLEESSGHTKVLEKQEKKWEGVQEKRRLMRLKPNITVEERLQHLSYRDVWD